jgi:hypothetical protein
MKLPLTFKRILLPVLLACLPLMPSLVLAQEQDLQETLHRLESLLEQQQQELQAQRKELAEQRALIQQLQASQKPGTDQSEKGLEDGIPITGLATQTEHDKAPTESSGDKQRAGQQVASVNSAPTGAVTDSDSNIGQQQARAELAKREQGPSQDTDKGQPAIQEDPSNTTFDATFPGAWHLPGSTAAMKIGGYVNLALINSFDPMLISDRFIVGSIPPDGEDFAGAKSGTDVTANQTRINFEVREETSRGQVRAFVEADFYGDGDTFRLRHAFGQFRWALAGKSWSTLMDIDSRPEEVDFEGINGEILARQAQVRFFPTFGNSMSFKMALEDPRTDVVNGVGAKGRGDLIVSVDRLPLGSLGSWDLGTWNSRVAVILRELVADQSEDAVGDIPGGNTTGWGITTSGRTPVTYWSEHDSLLWQITYGKGVGRYLNDLNTTGGGDAVFDPEGKLRPLPVFAGYISYRHRWPDDFRFLKKWAGTIRSNFTFSWVNIDNFDFQDDNNYKSTVRASANLIYLPTNNVRLGAELLWGQRKNKNDSKGTATQLQFSARYDF